MLLGNLLQAWKLFTLLVCIHVLCGRMVGTWKDQKGVETSAASVAYADVQQIYYYNITELATFICTYVVFVLLCANYHYHYSSLLQFPTSEDNGVCHYSKMIS